MNIFCSAYSAFALALLVALLGANSEGLEMRMNIGALLLGLWGIGWGGLLWLSRRVHLNRPSVPAVLLALCLCAGFALHGVNGMQVIPAALLREGLHLPRVAMGVFNAALLLFLGGGLALIILRRAELSLPPPRPAVSPTPEQRKHSRARMGLLALLLAGVAACTLIPTLREGMIHIFRMFASGDFTVVREFVASYGPYAMAVSFLLMILQSVAAPLPAFLVTFANANLFGWWQGAILSWISAMAGAALCFVIARILGRDVVERLTSRAGLQQVDVFFEQYGKQSILIARLLPFISFDIVSYAAGLTSMGFWSFFVATGIGQLPATLIYSYVGGMLTGGAQLLVTGLLVLFALSVLVVLLRRLYTRRKRVPA